jgi:hypothetical protein
MLTLISPDETVCTMRRCLIDKWESPMNFDKAVLILLTERVFHIDHITAFADLAFAQAKEFLNPSLDRLQSSV